jgi:mRNA interferase MazF
LKRGEIYLASLNPKKGDEIGKIRPVLIYQSDMLNDIDHTTTIVIPLSTKLINDAYPLRYRIPKREALDYDSDIVIDQIRSIDNQRLTSNAIASLHAYEMDDVDTMVKIVLGIKK